MTVTSHERGSHVGEMRWIPGGEFLMGSEDFYPEERPVRVVSVDGFWIDEHPVTRIEFRRFVRATGYVTAAERTPPAEPLPGRRCRTARSRLACLPKDRQPVPLTTSAPGGSTFPGAYWKRPGGAGHNVNGRDRHPVVHVAYEDAEAYAAWAGKRFRPRPSGSAPRAAASRGQAFAWGDEHFPDGKRRRTHGRGSSRGRT